MLNVSTKIIITQLLCCFYTPVCYFTYQCVVLAYQCVLLTHKSVKNLTSTLDLSSNLTHYTSSCIFTHQLCQNYTSVCQTDTSLCQNSTQKVCYVWGQKKQQGDTPLYRVQLSSSTGQNKVNGQLGIFSIVNGQATIFL